MPLQTFSIESLDALQTSLVGSLYERHMKRIVADLKARPDVSAARKIVISLGVKPIVEIVDGDLGKRFVTCIGARVVPSVKVTMPDESIKEIVASLGDDGSLLFNAAAPENPNQYTIDDINTERPGSGEIVPMRRDGRAKAAGE